MKTASVLISFIKKNTVLMSALALAAATSFQVHPDREYIQYFDFKTLTCLFCVLAVVCALKNIRFFTILAEKTVKIFKTTRMCILALVFITFVGSMFIANDMALLTFLPLGYTALDCAGRKNYVAFTFIMQNIAANLGGMLTPFGNPQNLYLYTRFNITNSEFVHIMFAPFIISIAVITICCLFVKSEPMVIRNSAKYRIPAGKVLLYLLLFAFSIAVIFRSIPYYWGLAVIPAVLFLVDKKALKAVDYPLLLTFAAFFVFAGNMSRIEIIRDTLSGLLERNTLLYSILSCQLISNVPSAVLLSQFTGNYRELLLGVNIGGVGTVIASLASLITFKEYLRHNPGRTWHYLGLFSAFNFVFLIILAVSMQAAILDMI